MSAICQIVVFVDLTLLAIIIALFVFASTIYRGAIRFASRDEEEKLERRKQLLQRRKVEMSEGLGGIDENDFPRELRKRLDELDGELVQMGKSILKSRDRAKVFGLRRMVVIPGILIILSIVFSGMGISLSGTWQTSLLGTSVVLLAGGLYFLYRNLAAIEYNSSIIDLSVLMEEALDAHATKTKPKLRLEFFDESLELERKLKVKRGETELVECYVSLVQGDVAKKATVRFTATEELEFTEGKVVKQGISYHDMRDPAKIEENIGDINPNAFKRGGFRIKVPDSPGEYKMSYWLQCEGFTEDEIFFKVIVE